MPAKSADLRPTILDLASQRSAGKRVRVAPPGDTVPDPRAAQPGRIGKVSVTGHFSTEVRHNLTRFAVEIDTNVQALLHEALNLLFAKHGVAEIAETDS